jgi:hypothetical protein
MLPNCIKVSTQYSNLRDIICKFRYCFYRWVFCYTCRLVKLHFLNNITVSLCCHGTGLVVFIFGDCSSIAECSISRWRVRSIGQHCTDEERGLEAELIRAFAPDAERVPKRTSVSISFVPLPCSGCIYARIMAERDTVFASVCNNGKWMSGARTQTCCPAI